MRVSDPHPAGEPAGRAAIFADYGGIFASSGETVCVVSEQIDMEQMIFLFTIKHSGI